jgi:pyruvate/2-oxoglutarate/acetoin dehydrogenase E1 component
MKPAILENIARDSAAPVGAAPALRKCSYADALREGLSQAMELSDRVCVLGQLVDYQPGVFGTTTGLAEKFGTDRVQDFAVAESAMTAAGMGAAIAGMRPVLIHHRLDFMIYSMDAIVNWLSLWRFKSNSGSGVPLVIRAIVGKGWGQGPQHSKSLHAWFAHLPGIKVAMPATAFDAKGLLLESIFGEDPVIMIEHRSLFGLSDHVPEEPYRVRFGKAAYRRRGEDVTLVAAGMMVHLAMRAAAQLAPEGIDVEVLDLRTVSPIDMDSVRESVSRTGRLVVADPAWRTGSIAAEIIAAVCEKSNGELKSAPARVCLPDSHTPMSSALEQKYYPTEATIVDAVRAQFA